MEKSMEEKAYEILDKMLAGIGYDYELKSSTEEGQIYFQIESPEAGRLIGRRAQMIQALQFLLNRMMKRISKDAPRCIVDVENYRERRKNDLVEQALEIAEKVKDSGESSRMKPMNAYDRRAVHKALADDEDVETESIASKDSSWKTIIISPVDSPDEDEDDYDDYDDYDSYDDEEEEVDDGDDQEGLDDGEQPEVNKL